MSDNKLDQSIDSETAEKQDEKSELPTKPGSGDEVCPPIVPIEKPIETEATDLALLPQDHPLMLKFQRLLKEHLLRAKAEVTEQLSNIKSEIKVKEKAREEAGIKLYDMQENLKQQEIQIQEFEQEVEQQIKLSSVEELLIEKLKAEFKEKETKTNEMERQYKKRMRELEQINELEGNTFNWVEELENSVKNAKRVVHRDTQMQNQLNDEKRRNELLYFHIDMEVKKLESELASMQEELEDMANGKEILAQSLANANADLTVLENEHKRLTQAWGEVIVSISHRDKIMHGLQTSIDQVMEKIKNSDFAILATKKQIHNANLENSKLQNFKSRIAADFNLLKSECLKQEENLQQLEKKVLEMPSFMAETEKELQYAKKEGTIIEGQLNRILWRLDKLNKIKFELEEDILKTAQEQLIADKASKYRLKILQNTQEQRRNMELNLSTVQKQLAEALVKIEEWKGTVTRLNRDYELEQQKYMTLEKNYDKLSNELKSIEDQISFKLKYMDKLNKELDEARIAGEEDLLASVSERKIKQLEKLLQTLTLQIREHQQFWLMMQNHFVNLSNKRQRQLTEIQMTSKQLSIMKQKALKIDMELKQAENEMRELTRQIHAANAKVDFLNTSMYNKQQKHEMEEEECLQEHTSLMDNLRDKELEVLQLEEKINELKDNIDHLKELVLEKHRESLSWETQYKMVEETLHWRKEQKSQDNELNVMKTEIHRMQIRHQQLKRAQEKLMQDLEHTILHRETIFFTASRREQTQSKLNKSKAPTTIQSQVQDTRDKIKKNEQELQKLSGTCLQELTAEYEAIQMDIVLLRQQVDAATVELQEICKRIDEAVLQKHINIELIVREQNRVKAYQKLAKSTTTPRIYYSENVLDVQQERAMSFNENLQDVVQMLINDFPERNLMLHKILQVLKL